ncbi:MAG: DUF192 domain-containing protein [Phyllobacteriaceae bacterium]|nr:DUF192 domain-containing protein [Phyllobacteriaceae bacterium]
MLKRFFLVLSLLVFAQTGATRADIGGQIIATDPFPLIAETAAGRVYFSIEIADDPNERERGLMFRDDLAKNHGMLFVFEKSGEVGFWMKDTPLALDLVFIDENGIVAAVRRGEPLSMAVIAPGVVSRFVLELEAGTALRTGLAAGVRVRHPAIDGVAG